MIKVVLIDDQMLVRSGIRGLLNLTDDIRVVAEAADGAEAVPVIRQAQADVLLLDVRMPLCSGIELLQTESNLPPTILLTTFDDDDVLYAGMRAGARGFLLKDISPERLAEGIRRVATGATLFRPGLTERTRASYENQGTKKYTEDNQVRDSLTEREIETLALMAAGLNNNEIAVALGLSEGTIKNHVSSILSKLSVRDRMRAALRGIELGCI